MTRTVSIHRLLLEIIAIVAICEALVMFALPVLAPGIEGVSEALLDSALLSILAAPPIMWRTRRFERRGTAPVTDSQEEMSPRVGQSSRLRRQVLLPLMLAMAVVHLVATSLIIRSSDKVLEREAAILGEEISARLEDHDRMNRLAMRSLLHQISDQGEVRDAFLAGDRDGARDLLLGDFERMRGEFGISHLYLHNLDRTNFLRVHQPEQSGGIIERWTLDEAMRTGEFAAGFEPGLLGTFTLRCVLPWEVEGAIVGYLEMGKEFDRVVSELGDSIVLAVPKRALDEATYRETVARMGLADTWDKYPGIVIPYASTDSLARSIFERLVDPDKLCRTIDDPSGNDPNGAGGPLDCPIIHDGGRVMQVAAIPLNDATGLPTAFMFVSRDVTALAGEYRRAALIASGALLIVIVGLMAAGWMLMGRLERVLDERSASLSDANEQLRLSQGSLRERETRLRTILETEPECVKILDSECRLLEMNPAGLALVEASSLDEVRGHSVLELIAPEHHDLFREGVAAALAGGQVHQEFEIVGLKGTRRWMEQYAVALVDPLDPDEPSQILAVTRDITDRLAAEAELIGARDRAQRALREAQDLRRAVDEQSIVSITDPSGKIVDVNDTFCRISGYSREELIGQDHRILNLGDHPKSFWVQMWKTVASGEPWRAEVCNRAKDGSIYWVDSIVAPFKDAQGRIEKYVSIRTDITDRKIAEDRVRQNEAKLREAQRIARIGSWSLDLQTNHLEWSDIIYEIFEIEKDEFGASYEAFCAVVHPEDREAVDAAYKESVQNRTPYSIGHRLLMADGRVKYVHERGETFYDGNGAALCTVGTVQDVSELKEAEVELRSAARTDKLTNLANRALFQERLEQALERSRGDPEYMYAVLFLDLDRFKVVNDSLGHGAGDQLLQRIGDRLRSAVRVSDSLSQTARGHTAARLGGDEFVVLLDGLDGAEDATIVAQRLLDMLDEPHRLGRQLVYSPASIGIVTSDTPMGSAEEVLRNADIAMYEAKAAGKGCYVIFDASMHDRIRDRHNLEHDLRGSIDRGELRLVYQPIICLSDGELRGCEALVRWDHPERGVVGPVEFIPIAEDTGFITVLGEWVLWEACRRFASWREKMGERAPRYVSVNVSRSQLMLAGLPELISRVLTETGVPPECLLIEVTESAIMRDVEASKRILHSLKDVGVKLAIDDFGTGYSSLASLHQFPVDVLKIDRAFIAEIESSREFLALTSAISQLAHSLGITTIAEGIETSDHVIVLQSLDCDMGQGYLFAKPLDGDEILTYTVPEFDLEGIRNDDARKAA